MSEEAQSSEAPQNDLNAEEARAIRDRIKTEIGKRIVGQSDVVDLLLIGLCARGHGLFIGVPGLAKTLLISTLAQATSLNFNRVQFTPDLMPSDITGTDVLDEDPGTHRRSFRFVQGPVFTNILLADEINRTPPKTQAALLQAMQEGEVTAGGRTYPLDSPFQVFATQNPIEQEGTYPLPEAQLDRFMFSINVFYPNYEEEVEVVRRTTQQKQADIQPVASREEILKLQTLVRDVAVSDHVLRYAVRLVQATRPGHEAAPEEFERFVSWGAGPRAGQFLVLGGKARALLDGRHTVDIEDIQALAPPVLGHRVLLNYHAEAEKIDSNELLDDLMKRVMP
jgi:MoxR-like ATPase